MVMGISNRRCGAFFLPAREACRLSCQDREACRPFLPGRGIAPPVVAVIVVGGSAVKAVGVDIVTAGNAAPAHAVLPHVADARFRYACHARHAAHPCALKVRFALTPIPLIAPVIAPSVHGIKVVIVCTVCRPCHVREIPQHVRKTVQTSRKRGRGRQPEQSHCKSKAAFGHIHKKSSVDRLYQ